MKILLLTSILLAVSNVFCTDIEEKKANSEVKWMKDLDAVSKDEDKKSLTGHLSTTNHLVGPGRWTSFHSDVFKKSAAMGSSDGETDKIRPPMKWRLGRRGTNEIEENDRPPMKWVNGKRSSTEDEKEHSERPPMKWRLGRRGTNEIEESDRPPMKWVNGKRSSTENEKENSERPPMKWRLGKRRASEIEESDRPPMKWVNGKRSSTEDEKEHSERPPMKWRLGRRGTNEIEVSDRPPMKWVNGKRSSTENEKENSERPPMKWRLGKRRANEIEESDRLPMKWVNGKRSSTENEKENSERPPMKWRLGKRRANEIEESDRPPMKWRLTGKRDQTEENESEVSDEHVNEKRGEEHKSAKYTVADKRSSDHVKEDKRIIEKDETLLHDKYLKSTFDEDMMKKKRDALYASDGELQKRFARPENPWLKLLYPEHQHVPKRQIPWFDKKTSNDDVARKTIKGEDDKSR